MSMVTLINCCFCNGAVLITFGALLGKVNLDQLMVIALIESFFWCLNEGITVVVLGTADVGGTMVIHMFGAFFGVAASYRLKNKDALKCE